MTEFIQLREVTEGDLKIFFEQQREPAANLMAAFPARNELNFQDHWKNKILGNDTVAKRTIIFDCQVAGNILSWEQTEKRFVGYWIGKNYWSKGVATKALSEFLGLVEARPLYAHVAKHNIASIRVLEKCGFTICGEETESSDAPSDGVEELVLKLTANENG